MPIDQSSDSVRRVGIVVEPDAHGQAALLRAESILHALVETLALTNAEAIEVVQRAAEVKREVATAAGESLGRMQQSLDLLSRMTASFATDEMRQSQIMEGHFPRLA